MNHTSGAGLIARHIDLQSSALSQCLGCPRTQTTPYRSCSTKCAFFQGGNIWAFYWFESASHITRKWVKTSCWFLLHFIPHQTFFVWTIKSYSLQHGYDLHLREPSHSLPHPMLFFGIKHSNQHDDDLRLSVVSPVLDGCWGGRWPISLARALVPATAQYTTTGTPLLHLTNAHGISTCSMLNLYHGDLLA